MAAILGPAALLIVQKATGSSLDQVGGIVVPFADQWWRSLTAPFAYVDVGYLFVVAIGLAIFAPGIERRLGAMPTAVLLLACGALGMLVAGGIANAQAGVEAIAGGNGMALGVLAAWFAIRRAEVHHAIDDDYDSIGVLVVAAVLLALPIFDSSADPFAGLVGAAVGGLAGLAASALRHD
jgi:membrane associated rhomboid family serine protease